MRKETKVVRRSNNPKFEGSFCFNITQDDVKKGEVVIEVRA